MISTAFGPTIFMTRINHARLCGNVPSTQTELRNSRFWGRMYLEGWPQPIQYFVSHFSGPPDMEPRPLILADPPMACGPLANAAEIRWVKQGDMVSALSDGKLKQLSRAEGLMLSRSPSARYRTVISKGADVGAPLDWIVLGTQE